MTQYLQGHLKDVLKFLQPDNYIASTIIKTLIFLFIVWILLTFIFIGKYIYLQILLKRAQDVKQLSEALKNQFNSAEKENEEVTDYEGVFNLYCETKGIIKNSILKRHLKAIYFAGVKDSKLEVGELLKHTSSELFSINNFIKGLLSTFIIFGLLGTLFGIADTLSKLQPALTSLNADNANSAATNALNNLLTQLGSAFAPSIFGVFFTIVGVIWFSIYVNAVCAPLKGKLEYITLTVWIPELLPSSTQQLQNNVQITDEQIKKSFEVAEKAASFAEDIQLETDKFTSNIKKSNKMLHSMEEYISRFNDFSNSFFSSVNELTSFQGELRALYEQMSKQSGEFQESVMESIKSSNSFQEGAKAAFEIQSDQIAQIIGTLKMYEDIYVKQNKEIADVNKDIMTAAKYAFEGVGHRNQELINSIGEPLINNLTNIEKTLRVQLLDINDRFNTFDTPIKQAALTIESSFEMVDKRTESFVRELQREFLKQEENNKEQLENMKATNNQIVELLKQLSQNTSYQNNSIEMFTKILSKMNNINPIAFAEAAADSRVSIWSKIRRIFRKSKMN